MLYCRHTHRLLHLFTAFACVAIILKFPAQADEPPQRISPQQILPAQILQDLRSFNELGSVLYVAAHPDDENTQLITYLARGRGYRTAYLSLTRGDGGQNVLGPEFGDELGVIRTQELLAARRLDGGRQFFSRARDFGYSKDYRQTLTKWDHQQVLSDIVRVIRTFQPDVMITRFSTLPGPTHGHHTASAILALEAFKIAGDPSKFPDQLTTLTPWQPKRILLNGFGVGFRRPGQIVPGATTARSALRIDISGNDPVLKMSFAQIAALSRSMHKTQGFANYTGRAGAGPSYESFQLLGGDPATKDILDNIDTAWNRIPGGADIATLTDNAISQFNPQGPSAIIPILLTIKSRLTSLPGTPLLNDKRRQLDRILQSCLGLEVQTTIPEAEVVPGEQLQLHHTAIIRANVPANISVKWVATRYPSIEKSSTGDPINLTPNTSATRDSTQSLPATTPLSEPYWLREPETPGMFRVDDPSLIGRPENPPAFLIEQVFEVAGQTLVIPDQPVQITASPKPDSRRTLDVIPPVSLSFASNVQLFAPGSTHPVTVQLTAYRANSAGTLQLQAPPGWAVAPANQPFNLQSIGDRASLAFTVTAPDEPTTANIIARANIDGKIYDNNRIEISYSHIPVQLLQPPAELKAVCLNLQIRSHNIGYIAGAGDSVAQSLTQMGCTVTQLTGPDLSPDRLRKFDAIVIGIRAFNVRTDLAPALPALFAYVQAGGNIIEQYNTPAGLKTTKLAPYDLKLSRDLPHNRVTDENAPITLLVPDHPIFNTPNKITAADFTGWVQERGLNFASEWDTTHFTPLIACNDIGEAPLKGGLLVARYGKGYFVYTGLSWFRQLPAGVPGAYRLFANLISLGKK
jgi:LmbE family N-acetylglucosaminyl deacetylase